MKRGGALGGLRAFRRRLFASRPHRCPPLPDRPSLPSRTLIRFDEVYAVYFKTNKKLIREYPNLKGYVADVTQAHGGAVGRT